MWSHDFERDRVVCCQGMRNGNVLVIFSGSNRAIELTHDGEIVWSWSPPRGVLRDCFMLPSGHLLATTTAGAMEIARGKQILWEIEEAGIWQVRRGE